MINESIKAALYEEEYDEEFKNYLEAKEKWRRVAIRKRSMDDVNLKESKIEEEDLEAMDAWQRFKYHEQQKSKYEKILQKQQKRGNRSGLIVMSMDPKLDHEEQYERWAEA